MEYTRHKLLFLLFWFLLNILYLEVTIYINPYINPSFIAIPILIGEIIIEVAWFAVGIIISGAYDMFMVSYN
jgi:hypothetical protein